MADYLKKLGISLGGNGDWNGIGFYLVLAAVMALLMAGIVWVLFRFRKKEPRDFELDEEDKTFIDETDGDFLSPYDSEPPKEEGATLFGNSEERQMQLESDIQSVSHRLSVTTALLPLLFAAVLVFVYLDLRQRIGNVADKDVREVQEDVSEDMSSMASRMERLEQTLKERLTNVENRIPELAENVEAYGNRLGDMVDAKEKTAALEGRFTESLQQITDRLSLVQKDVAQYGTQFQKLSQEVDTRIGQGLEAVSQQKKTVQKATEELGALANEVQEIKERVLDLGLKYRLLEETKADTELVETSRTERTQMQENLTGQIQSLRSDITRLAEQFVRARTGPPPSSAPRTEDTSPEVPPEDQESIFEQEIPR